MERESLVLEWASKLKTTKIIESLDLINSEGAILKAHKIENDLFVLVDEWKKVVDVLDGLQMFEYTRGDFDIKDTSGRYWNYKTLPMGMGKSQDELDKFIGIVDQK
jgi:hypothetical protein